MTSFVWKRKLGQDVCKRTVEKFSSEAAKDEENDQEICNDDVFFRNKKSTSMALEDSLVKSARLTEEGSRLAENERYWEAIKKWDEALSFTPKNEKIHEMKAQSLLLLNELHPAVQAAEHAVKLSPRWWVAYQTLGRAYLGLGEVTRAIVNFSKAVHVNPANQELWQDDLGWAFSLLDKLKIVERQTAQSSSTAETVVIRELESECEQDEKQMKVQPYDRTQCGDGQGTEFGAQSSQLGNNWVRMRARSETPLRGVDDGVQWRSTGSLAPPTRLRKAWFCGKNRQKSATANDYDLRIRFNIYGSAAFSRWTTDAGVWTSQTLQSRIKDIRIRMERFSQSRTLPGSM